MRAMSSRKTSSEFDAEMLVDLGAPARGAHRRVGMREREVPALRIHDVHVEVVGEVFPERQRFVVEPHALRRQVVGADDGGVAAGVAAAEIALLEDRDIGDAVIAGEVVGGRHPVSAAADDHHVVGRT